MRIFRAAFDEYGFDIMIREGSPLFETVRSGPTFELVASYLRLKLVYERSIPPHTHPSSSPGASPPGTPQVSTAAAAPAGSPKQHSRGSPPAAGEPHWQQLCCLPGPASGPAAALRWLGPSFAPELGIKELLDLMRAAGGLGLLPLMDFACHRLAELLARHGFSIRAGNEALTEAEREAGRIRRDAYFDPPWGRRLTAWEPAVVAGLRLGPALDLFAVAGDTGQPGLREMALDRLAELLAAHGADAVDRGRVEAAARRAGADWGFRAALLERPAAALAAAPDLEEHRQDGSTSLPMQPEA
eukprot:tig00020675_g12690.t1